MSNCMEFSDDWREFLKSYSFKDTEELYTNGSELIQVFRVEQLIEHLLKAQEPRVLTLEEVKRLQSLKDGAVWLEMWRGAVFPALPEILLSNISYFVAIPFNGYRSWVENEYYNKTWRCWSSRPTKEQMEEAKWDDPSSY